MPADSFRDVFPITIMWTRGEQPASTKLEGMTQQIETGLSSLSRAVGDLWGDNFSSNPIYRHEDRPANIVNLARLIGPASMLNPLYPGRDQEFTVTWDSLSIPSNVNQFKLPFPPVDIAEVGEFGVEFALHAMTNGLHTSLNTLDAVVFANFIPPDPDGMVLVNSAGKYTVDTAGIVYTYSPTGSYAGTGDIVYTTYLMHDAYDKARMNVIPDWSETAVLCTVSDQGIYWQVDLPVIDSLCVYDQNGIAYGTGTQPGIPTSYTPKLPYGLVKNFTDQYAPEGAIQLWDDVAQAIVDNAIFYIESETRLRVTGATLAAGSNRYRVVTVGSTITETLAHLRFWMANHAHGLSGITNDFTKPIEHSDILWSDMPRAIALAYWSKTVLGAPTSIPYNWHPQYLCRYGWKKLADSGQYDNAMLGDLFIGASRSDYTTYSYNDDAVESHKIYFGSESARLYWDPAEFSGLGGLVLDQATGNTNLKIEGTLEATNYIRTAGQVVTGHGSDEGTYFFGSAINNTKLLYNKTYKAFGFFSANSIEDSSIQAGTVVSHMISSTVDPALTNYDAVKHSVVPDGATNDPTTIYQTNVAASYGKVFYDASEDVFTIFSNEAIEVSASTNVVLKTNGSSCNILLSAVGANSTITLNAYGDITLQTSGAATFANCANALILPTLAIAPPTVVKGKLYYNTSADKLYYYNGTDWKEIAIV